MVAKTLARFGLACLLGLVLATPSEALAVATATNIETVAGRNNRHDTSPGSCDVDTGCFTNTGSRCNDNPGERCDLLVTPKGRCTQGTGSCIWPQGAGSCMHDGGATPVDPVPCLTDAYIEFLQKGGVFPGSGNGPSILCAEARGSNGMCDMSTNNSNCDCNGTDPTADVSNTDPQTPSWEGVVCGPGSEAAVCSDGDPLRNITGYGVNLCIELCIDPTCTPASACGSTHTFEGAVVGLKYPNGENPSDLFTLQRRPGSGYSTADAGGPIQTINSTFFFVVDDVGTGDFAAQGIRRIRPFVNAHHFDETFASSAVNGTVDDTGPTTYLCNIPVGGGWASGQPVSGRCSILTDTFCIADADCTGAAGICDPATFLYCHDNDNDPHTLTSANGFPEPGVEATGFYYTRALTPGEIAAAGGQCPPDCFSGYDFDTFEEEAFTQAAFSGDVRTGMQLLLDNMEGPRAIKGDHVLPAPIVSINALFLGDLRCIIGGDPSRADPNDHRIGRCQSTSDSCDPTQQVGSNGCPGSDFCLYCHGTADAANAPHASTAGSYAVFGGNAGFDPARGNSEALPVGYDTHGIEAVDIRGRVGRMNGQTSNLDVPLLLFLATGPTSSLFKDNTCAGAGVDKCDLGQVNGGATGIGPTFTYFNIGDPVPHEPNAAALPYQVNLTVPPFNPGTPQGALIRTSDWGVGADGVPGCLGDNTDSSVSTSPPPCDEPLGDSNAFGSTGTDDVEILYDYSLAQDGSDMRSATQIRLGKGNAVFALTPIFSDTLTLVLRDLPSIGNTNGLDVVGKVELTFCPISGRAGPQEFITACIDSDLDEDGFLDEQDGCPLNPTLALGDDTGGVASASDPGGFLPDGILDACQCGDVSDDGRVSGTDATAITRACLGLAPYTATAGCQTTQTSPTPFIVEKCDVGGPFADGVCSGTDGSLVKRGTLGLPPGLDLTCTAYLP